MFSHTVWREGCDTSPHQMPDIEKNVLNSSATDTLNSCQSTSEYLFVKCRNSVLKD